MGKSRKNKKKSETNAMFFIILLALVIFIISTYAWFSTQKNVSITNLNGTVEVAEGLEISLDANTWSNSINLGEGGLDIVEDAYDDNKNLKPSEMLPVSTTGMGSLDTSSENVEMLRGKVTNSIILENIQAVSEADTEPASATFGGFFAFDIFLKNESKTDDDDELQLNYDSSLQIMEDGNAETGLQNTARVAFAKYTGTTDTTAVQADILDATVGIAGSGTSTISDVAIWEPNSNDHVEYIVNNNNKITWSSSDQGKYATKLLANGTRGFDLTTQMPTYVLRSSSKGQTIADIYRWDGTETNLAKQNVLQTTKTSEEDYSIKEGVQNLISTTDGVAKFTIPANKICRIRVYLWLEGQDVDCINYASHGGGVNVNIGLVKGSDIGSHEPAEEP